MGINEARSSKSKRSSSTLEQSNTHTYPDWAAMQAHYGPTLGLPPYYQSAMASGHVSQAYMWNPLQPMMPPYAPYGAMYPPGGVCGHAAVPLGSHPHSMGVPTSLAPANQLKLEMPTKSSGSAPSGYLKKLKVLNGLSLSVGKGSAESNLAGAANGESESTETEGSSEQTDDDATEVDQTRKRKQGRPPYTGGGAGSDSMWLVASAAGPVMSPGNTTTLELTHSTIVDAKPVSTIAPQNGPTIDSEALLRHELELRRERRKQSNRESARRSRLRKQAEIEQLARKVETLTAENAVLRLELNELAEGSSKLRVENAEKLEELKAKEIAEAEEASVINANDNGEVANVDHANENEEKAHVNHGNDNRAEAKTKRVAEGDESHVNTANVKRARPAITDDFLAAVEISGSAEKSSKEVVRLHQLLNLDKSPRANGVTAVL